MCIHRVHTQTDKYTVYPVAKISVFIIPINSRQNVVILFFKLNWICLTSELPSFASSSLKKKKNYLSTLGSNCSSQDLQFSLGACGIFSQSMQTLSCGMRDPVPWPGIQPGPLIWRVLSLRHWAFREALASSFWTQLLPFSSWANRIQSLDLSCVFFGFLSCFIIKLWSLFRF